MIVAKTIALMDARQVDALPDGGGWQYEPKWDGFRCLAKRDGDKVDLQGKSGKSLARFFPEVAVALAALKPRRFVLDGELAIPQGSTLDFEALQMRLHPSAGRIARLAGETPAILIVFDLLRTAEGKDLTDQPLRERRRELECFIDRLGTAPILRLSPATERRTGFTRKAPGGPSRWSTERSTRWEPLKPRLVAEVQYDHVTGDRFRHGTGFLRWRPDKQPEQCTFDQLKREARPSRLLKAIVQVESAA